MKAFTLFTEIILSAFILSCTQSVEDKLSRTIEKINSLENYSYSLSAKSGNGIDLKWIEIFSGYVKAVNDPTDTIIGAKFLLYDKDTSNIMINYHHYISTNYFSYNKTIEIDTINPDRASLASPMPIKALSLLNYYMTNKDSVDVQFSDYGDSTKYTFTIKDKEILFWNIKPLISYKNNIISKYVLWINKESLPYRLEQHGSDYSDLEQIKYLPKIRTSEVLDKQRDIYIPVGYTMVNKYTRKPINEADNYIGKQIIDLSLESVEGKQINLATLKNNLLIEFTSKPCGPCKLAIPFLTNFSNTYKDKGFKVISIETYPFTRDQLMEYKKSQKIEYEYLLANKELNGYYNIRAVPIFFIVDKNGIIKKVLTGYAKGITDKEIIKFANTL